jgi:hypothetical protein
LIAGATPSTAEINIPVIDSVTIAETNSIRSCDGALLLRRIQRDIAGNQSHATREDCASNVIRIFQARWFDASDAAKALELRSAAINAPLSDIVTIA